MSTQVFPSLVGLGWDVVRTPMWSADITRSVSGKEVRVNYWTYPLYKWELVYDFLRSDSTNLELQSLFGFFNARRGSYESFQYQDADDNAVTDQAIGTGNGSTVDFQ